MAAGMDGITADGPGANPPVKTDGADGTLTGRGDGAGGQQTDGHQVFQINYDSLKRPDPRPGSRPESARPATQGSDRPGTAERSDRATRTVFVRDDARERAIDRLGTHPTSSPALPGCRVDAESQANDGPQMSAARDAPPIPAWNLVRVDDSPISSAWVDQSELEDAQLEGTAMLAGLLVVPLIEAGELGAAGVRIATRVLGPRAGPVVARFGANMIKAATEGADALLDGVSDAGAKAAQSYLDHRVPGPHFNVGNLPAAGRTVRALAERKALGAGARAGIHEVLERIGASPLRTDGPGPEPSPRTSDNGPAGHVFP